MILYLMMREIKPRAYLEIGSGMSTYYSTLAVSRNKEEGSDCEISVIDPYPTDKLQSLSAVKLRVNKVEEVSLEVFDALGAGDVLFIDSTHVLKLGGDGLILIRA